MTQTTGTPKIQPMYFSGKLAGYRIVREGRVDQHRQTLAGAQRLAGPSAVIDRSRLANVR
jgi:hypothetical protein